MCFRVKREARPKKCRQTENDDKIDDFHFYLIPRAKYDLQAK